MKNICLCYSILYTMISKSLPLCVLYVCIHIHRVLLWYTVYIVKCRVFVVVYSIRKQYTV